jgi:two-component system, response regulator PdtaR
MSKPAAPVALIVEDEPLVRMVAREAFVDAGFSVLEAEHAAEALAIYVATPAHVLFTDVSMPGDLNGIDLAERLSAMTPGLAIIITSALPIVRPVDHLLATFVTKPYSLDAVCRTALALLAA